MRLRDTVGLPQRRLAMRPDVLPFRHTGSGTWSYLLLDPDGGEASLVDPVLDSDAPSRPTAPQSFLALLDSVLYRAAFVPSPLRSHPHSLSSFDYSSLS